MLEATPIPTNLGEFEVVRRIGRGAMGIVLEVRSRETGGAYAAKLIVRPGDSLARERFRREAELLARCDRHPGVVKVHSFGEAAGHLYMVMDLVRGEGLDDLLEREGKLPPRRAARIARDLALALGHAHALGIVHRDVKPANVLLEADGTLRLSDFGLATAVDLERLTKTGQFVGTIRYASPEQVQGQQRPGPPADVFAVGTILFQAICGRTPFEELRNPVEIMRELERREPIVDVRLLAPDCPDALAAIVARALGKRPEERPATGAELARDLDLFLEGKLPGASSAAPRASRRRAAAALAALAVLGLGVGLLPVLGRESRARGTLGDATAALERARVVLARRDRRPGEAVEAAARARVLALAAESLGAANAPAVAREALETLVAARTADAEQYLAAGHAREARELLEAATPGTLEPVERLLLARARHAEGRADVAEARALLELTGLGARRADACELAGDVLASRGDPAGAEAAYGLALDATPARPASLRTKRGVAAAAAGDDATALAELKGLCPDLAALAPDRATNARVAGLAPALWRRGLATAGDAGERDLEAAWRLADPPAPLATAVARRWVQVAEPSFVRWNEAYGTDSSVADLPGLRRPIALHARARQLDPTSESPIAWQTFDYIDNWAARSGVDPGVVERKLRAILEEVREPVVLHEISRALWRQHADRARHDEAIALELEAIDRFPAWRPDEPRYVPRLQLEIAEALTLYLGMEARPLDEEHLDRICDRGPVKLSTIKKASYYRTVGEFDKALDLLAHAPPWTAAEPFGHASAVERISTLLRMGHVAEAVAFIDSTDGDMTARLRGSLRDICRLLENELERTPRAVERAVKLRVIGEARAYLRDGPEAQRCLERLRQLEANDEAARLEATIARIQSGSR